MLEHLSEIGVLITLVSVTGAGFYAIGKLSARVDGHDKSLDGIYEELAMIRTNHDHDVEGIYARLEDSLKNIEFKLESIRKDLIAHLTARDK